ncbi:MAG: hypothetical protein QNL62_08410 [Gammaproteobacteria bacterium]|nr:hypothetical protein [Gammaproteobacteria bacterium]
MEKNRRILKFLIPLVLLLPFFLLASLFVPALQKHLINTQLDTWISHANVDYIQITPFSIKIDNLAFKYQEIDIRIGHLDSEFSPFELLNQRIRIDKFVLNKFTIDDFSLPATEKNDATLLFPGLFPYLDMGYIYDIGHLDVHANYSSPGTGPIQLAVSAQSVNETTTNPLKLQIIVKEVPDIPDVQELSLDASIVLKQHNKQPIDAQQSRFDIKLSNQEGIAQFLSLQLAMKQLPLPKLWQSFPFDKQNTHYLKKPLHPESIELHITHSNQHQDTLSEILYSGEYNGNEGIIKGDLEILTDKDFLKFFKTLQLPRIESNLIATFLYNTRSLQGNINLNNKLQIEDYADVKHSSLPKQIDVSNQLIASIDEQQLLINSFLLGMVNSGQDYLKILTHKPLSVNLNNLPELLEQRNSDLLTININQLPLNWFNDFIPDYHIDKGILDTDVNLSIADNTLTLKTNRPLSLRQLTLLENSKPGKKPLLNTQNLEADFILSANQKNLSAEISKLELYQGNANKVKDTTQSDTTDKPGNSALRQASTSISFNLKQPLDKKFASNPLTLESRGQFNINEIVRIPVLDKLLNEALSEPLSESLPKALALNYDFSLQGEASRWNLSKAHITLSSANNKKLFTLANQQNLQVKQDKDKFILQTHGEMLSGQINQFDLKWLAPAVKKYAQPYNLSGWLGKMDFSLSSKQNNDYSLAIKQLKFNSLKAYKDKQLLFKDINLNAEIHSRYTADRLAIDYPLFTINQNNTALLSNTGSVVLTDPGNTSQQRLSINGKLNGYINRIMNLNVVSQYTHHKLSHQSVLNADYKFHIKNDKLTVSQSDLHITHPKSKGRLDVQTHKPIALSLASKKQDKKYNFSQDGHLSFKLTDFDIKPYEALFSHLPLTFNHVNGHIDLVQNKKRQEVTFKQPLKIHNIHYKDTANALLEPFDISLDFTAKQFKNITHGQIKHFSIVFLNKKTHAKQQALDLQANFKLDQDKPVILSTLDSTLELLITQWLNQPLALPQNTLTQGILKAEFTLDQDNNIQHNWLINDLVDKQGKKIVESITINGTGQLESLSSIKLDLPIIMKSLSGTSNIDLKTHTQLTKDQKKLNMNLAGKEIFLNDLLKLLAAINPQSEISKLESGDKTQTDTKDTNANNSTAKEIAEQNNKHINNILDSSPFWQSGMDISAQLNIDRLYYSDYMSYNDIKGWVDLDDRQLHARGLALKFHDSPMKLDALFQFEKAQAKPYDIDFKTSLEDFNLGEFLHELNPNRVARADGVFDVDIKIYGGLSNLSQIRNELLFDLNIEGKNGVYHLIPADDVMTRSGGQAMAVVGEVVSVLPTSGFGLGIINRVVRFAKDINYDFINMHLVRQADLNTTIEQFQIMSPELRLYATGGITFKENTRLFDQPLAMDARINLAGEGAAIFYGLGLLNQEKDEYGFWKGPIINFSGTLNHQNDNFDEIINKAKKGTVVGGITNPFSGLVGNFKYRWFDTMPDYSNHKQKLSGVKKTDAQSGIDKKPEQTTETAPESKTKPVSKPETNSKAHSSYPAFFDETF